MEETGFSRKTGTPQETAQRMILAVALMVEFPTRTLAR
jgi:hypothetical protein